MSLPIKVSQKGLESMFNSPEFPEFLSVSFETPYLTVETLINGERSMKWYERLTQEELYTVLKLKSSKKNLTDLEKLLIKVVDIALEEPLITSTVSQQMAAKIEEELAKAATQVKKVAWPNANEANSYGPSRPIPRW